MTDERANPDADSAWTERPSAAQADGHANDPFSSGASLGRGLAPEGKTIDRIVQRVAELPDRTSPDDWPEAMLVTSEELRSIISEELVQVAAPEGERRPPLQEKLETLTRYVVVDAWPKAGDHLVEDRRDNTEYRISRGAERYVKLKDVQATLKAALPRSPAPKTET